MQNTSRKRFITRLTTWSLYILYGLITFGIYKLGVTFQFDITKQLAAKNSLAIIAFEKKWHLFIEPTTQQWALSQPYRIHFFNFFYNVMYPVGLISAFVFLRLKDKANFSRHCDIFFAMLFVSVCVYYIFPVMPPRLFLDCSHWGLCLKQFPLIDTVTAYSKPDSINLESFTAAADYYAAMPSMHMGMAAFATHSFYQYTRQAWLRYAYYIYPLIMLFTVLATGNHYLMDAICGILIYAIAALTLGFDVTTKPD